MATLVSERGISVLDAASGAGGSAINTNFRKLVRRMRRYSVLDTEFGAVADGTTDDATAINAAITAAAAAGGGEVYMPAGNYAINGTIVLKQGVHLVGEGRATIITLKNSAALTSWTTADLSAAVLSGLAPSGFPLYPAIGVEKGGSYKTGIAVRRLRINFNGANQADGKGGGANNGRSYAGISFINSDGMIVEDVECTGVKSSASGGWDNTTPENQRAAALLLMDCTSPVVVRGLYDDCGYDCVSLRAGCYDALLNGVRAGTTLTSTGRASFQQAYQVQRTTYIGCQGVNTNSSSSSAHAFMIHGCQHTKMIGCYGSAAGGSGYYSFGDNTDGSGDTAHDQWNTYPSSTLDEYGGPVQVVGCEFWSSGGQPAINVDTAFSHNVNFTGGLARKTGTAAVVFQSISSSTSNLVRRLKINGMDWIQETSANVATFTGVDGLLINDLSVVKANSSGDGVMLNRCKNVKIDGLLIHNTGAGAFNSGVQVLPASSTNCDNIDIAGIAYTRTASQALSYGVYIGDSSQTNVRVHNCNFTNVTNPVTFNGGTMGTGCRVYDNQGWTSRVRITGTVANGATTATVAHGLSAVRTPVAADVRLTPTNSLGNANRLYVSAIDATNVTITANADPGATTATFACEIDISRA